MKIFHRISMIALLAMIIFSCQTNDRVIQQFQHRVDKIIGHYLPDKSLGVLQAQLKNEGGEWILEGETTLKEAAVRIRQVTDSLLNGKSYRDRFFLLPHPELGDSSWGIVSVMVAHLREHPEHAAQLLDQSIMGRVIRLLKRQGGWYLVQTDYRYVGWMRRESFVRLDSASARQWENDALLRLKALFTPVHAAPNSQAEPVAFLVLNSRLKPGQQIGQWMTVQLPDGRTGYVDRNAVAFMSFRRRTRENLQQDIVKTARRMMGIPYLWGGNSSLSSDCSGFTQTVFKANGIDLPRDARQQARVGETIQPAPDFSNVEAGDLLFFGSKERITHVGISLGGQDYIHQSGEVHINSFDKNSPLFNEYRLNSLQIIKRLF